MDEVARSDADPRVSLRGRGGCPSAANAAYYAEILAEKATLRRLVEAGTRIVQLGYHGAASGRRVRGALAACSTRTVGRVVAWLKEEGLLWEVVQGTRLPLQRIPDDETPAEAAERATQMLVEPVDRGQRSGDLRRAHRRPRCAARTLPCLTNRIPGHPHHRRARRDPALHRRTATA
jgi:hypothetical protein